MQDLQTWQAAGVALAIGLLIGAERERSKHEIGSAGVRTFALVSLVGMIATLVPAVVAAVLVGSVGVMVAVGYWVSREADPGITSETALLATLALGALSPAEPAVAVGLAVAVTVLLVSKEALHRFVRDTVTDLERTDALKFFIAAFIVLPLLPDEPVGPYAVLVPQKVWLLVVFITGIGWAGYAATRALGSERGLLVAGLAGGFVSGAATTASMGTRYRAGTPLHAALAGALMASVATLLQLVAVTVVIEPDLTLALLPAVLAGCATLLAEAMYLTHRRSSHVGPPGATTATETGRPFALGPAIVLAAVISSVLLIATWMTVEFGTRAASLATATGSLADFHASAAAMATLVHGGQFGLGPAVGALGLGLVTNTGSKIILGAVGGGARYARSFVLALVPVAVVIGAALIPFT